MSRLRGPNAECAGSFYAAVKGLATFSCKFALSRRGRCHAAMTRMTHSSQDIRDRTICVCLRRSKAALSLPPRPGIRCLVDQLLKSATAVGANVEEAKAGSSTREFVRFVEIALREAREANYWLRICSAVQVRSTDDLKRRGGEADQLSRILASIAINTKMRARLGHAVFAFCILNFALLIS